MKLILYIVIGFALSACDNDRSSADHLKQYSMATVTLPSERTFHIYLADTPEKRRLGLSQVKAEDFDNNTGMLFIYQKSHEREFWMPETYFDLDIFFLDKNYHILDVHRSLKHHPYKATEGDVPRSKKVIARYALELKANSVFANELIPGISLQIEHPVKP